MQANRGRTAMTAMTRRAKRALLAGVLGLGLSGLAVQMPAALGAGGDVDSGTGVNASTPYDLVKTAANTLLQALDVHRAEYRQDPGKLRALVDKTLLPYFDSQLAAREVLGRHWDAATPEQRQRFVTAFYNSLLNNYGNALLDFTANRMQVLPYRGPADAHYAQINTRVRKSDGSVVSVNYALVNTPQGWKVWDVVVEGISYDKSFQQDFGEQIDREGLNAVIARLEHGEAPAAIRRTTGS